MQIGHGKQGVIIGEYGCARSDDGAEVGTEGSDVRKERSDNNALLGWIEPAGEAPSWIMWFTKQGDALLYTQREPSGAVIGEPIRIKASGDDPAPVRSGRMDVPIPSEVSRANE